MKKYIVICLCILNPIISCTIKDAENRNNKAQNETKKDIFLPPEKVIIADLPDSLQPKTISLENMPKPITAVIPQKRKIPFVYTTPDGKKHHTTLEPPVTKHLPVLKDEIGNPVLDKKGNSFILGEGGISQFANYTEDHGLALDLILCSAIDARGNLWFGTRGGGVSCYDGNSFITYTTAQGLANNSITSITADKNGNIWFLSDGAGVSRYDGRKFTTFTAAHGLSNTFLYFIFEDKTGSIWFSEYRLSGNSKGLVRFDGKKFISYNIDFDSLGYAIGDIEDQMGNIWIIFSKSIALFDGDSLTKIIHVPELPTHPFSTLTQDQFGYIWLGTVNGVNRYNSLEDLISGKFVLYTNLKGSSNNRVSSICEDKNGNLWFGTYLGGISKIEHATDSTSEKFTTYTSFQGLAMNHVMSIVEDKEGYLWIGTRGGGVSRYDGKGFTTFTTGQGLGNNIVRSITEDKKGNIWFGTFGNGVSRYNGRDFTTYTTGQGLADNIVKTIFEDKAGNVWIAGQNGLNQFEPSKDGQADKIITYTIPGLIEEAFWNIIQDKKGDIWFGMQGGGVCRFDGKGFTFYSTKQGLASDDIRSMAEDHMGNMWFGTFGKGVSCFNGNSFTSFTTERGLSNNFVMCLTTDKSGNLWIGTQEGLDFLSEGKIKKLIASAKSSSGDPKKVNDKLNQERNAHDLFTNFTVADGLPDNSISQVVELPNDKMAVGTNLGIVLFNKPSENKEEFTLTGLEIFNTNTGYPVKNINTGQNAMFLDSKGILWAGTGSNETALVRFDYTSLPKKEKPLSVTFKRITLNENNIPWYDLAPRLYALPKDDSLSFPPNVTEEVTIFGRALKEAEREEMREKYEGIRFDDITPFYPVPVNLVLPYKHNNITIHFAADELAKPNLVRYQYKLEGYNKEWSPVLKNTFATFGNIKEGTYTFKVKARYIGVAENEGNNWSHPVSYTFRVLPPWYRSWLAYIFYIIVLVLMVWQVHVFQKERTLQAEREKTQKKELEQAREIEKAYTELKSTQSQLIQSEKMASLGELTAGIAHEIQNPLNFVNNFSEISDELIEEMKEELANGNMVLANEIAGDIKLNLQKINHHGKRADAIVKGMLQHSRTSNGVKEPTDINALADEYLRLSYHGLRAKDKSFNADFKTDFDESLPKVNVIPQDIGRVLLNLINNAFYAVSERSKKREEGYKPTVSVSTAKVGDKLEIKVADNGNGIPENIKEKIFQPFFTTKPTGQGTGLGLSLSYDIVKAHGGELSVMSPFEKVETEEAGPDDPVGRGTGSEFIIKIPVSKNNEIWSSIYFF